MYPRNYVKLFLYLTKPHAMETYLLLN